MKRSPTRPHTLKHLPFFEVLASAPEGSNEAKLATAGLLTLRMIDHWVLAGPAIVEPESVSVRSVRQAIMALPQKEPVRESLLTIVNTMQMLRQVDLIPVLPRVFAYAQLLERQHGMLALASDAYHSIVRLADPDCDAELTLDAYNRIAYCERKLGALDAAYETASTLMKQANKRKDKARALRGKVGMGLVTMMRGDLPAAEILFATIATEAEKAGLMTEYAMATHNRGVVALRAGRVADAVVLSHRALKYATDPVDRERVLADLGAFLIRAEQYDAAIDALRILEVTAVSDEPRQNARANLLIVAARIGDRNMFEAARNDLIGVTLTVEARVNVLLESARGLAAFGELDEAKRQLALAEAAATEYGLGTAIAEIRRTNLPAAGSVSPARAVTRRRAERNDETSEVASDLRRMASMLVA